MDPDYNFLNIFNSAYQQYGWMGTINDRDIVFLDVTAETQANHNVLLIVHILNPLPPSGESCSNWVASFIY